MSLLTPFNVSNIFWGGLVITWNLLKPKNKTTWQSYAVLIHVVVYLNLVCFVDIRILTFHCCWCWKADRLRTVKHKLRRMKRRLVITTVCRGWRKGWVVRRVRRCCNGGPRIKLFLVKLLLLLLLMLVLLLLRRWQAVAIATTHEGDRVFHFETLCFPGPELINFLFVLLKLKFVFSQVRIFHKTIFFRMFSSSKNKIETSKVITIKVFLFLKQKIKDLLKLFISLSPLLYERYLLFCCC